MSGFFRFPHTPHIAWLGPGEPRDDKVLGPEEAHEFLRDEILIEEKVDGANLGFSVSPDGELRAQNRGHYLERPFDGQFLGLTAWMAAHEDGLFDALGSRLVLFGEWCAARHSLDYSRLSDLFLGFDIYDTETGRFWCRQRRNDLTARLAVAVVPTIAKGVFSLGELIQMLGSQQSAFRDGAVEGLYLRRDSGEWLDRRAKLVHPNFTQSIAEHWSKRRIDWNRLAI